LNWQNLPNYPQKTSFLRTSGHFSLYRTSITMWKEQPLFGFGLKSFRIKCWEILPRVANRSCSTHSHNYYFELLSEAGIVGAGLIVLFFLILLKDSYYYLRKYNEKEYSDLVFIIPVIIVVFLEIWPLKSSGSFFTTWNATLFWLNVSILMAVNKKSI
jgi:Lipid A core - O-antigen ligase and related enzymes